MRGRTGSHSDDLIAAVEPHAARQDAPETGDQSGARDSEEQQDDDAAWVVGDAIHAADVRTVPEPLPVPTVTFASHDEHLDAVALDLGVSICPESTQRFYPRPGVTFVPVPDMEPAPLNLVWRTDRSSPLVLDFIGFAKDAARELAEDREDAGDRGD